MRPFRVPLGPRQSGGGAAAALGRVLQVTGLSPPHAPVWGRRGSKAGKALSLGGDASPQTLLPLAKRLRDGVIRDIERQNRKKENIRLLGEQIILTEQLEAEREKAFLAKDLKKHDLK
ncbi:protein PET117 homolog, mitochondrial isoform X2 [Saccopteryx leptura]|uniref:protein PET117 homolog, mitochondrial isoform X2 n=1 Tax=Saccopteryx leptura TaxID=249018 RepID=UPI00339C2BD5